MIVGIVNIGFGNIQSIKTTLLKLGVYKIIEIERPKQLTECNRIILPGHGSFLSLMRNVSNIELLKALFASKKKILGICLGMQMICAYNMEGLSNGFGLIPTYVRHLKVNDYFKVPNIGWNQVIPIRKNDFIKRSDFFYFSHSYYVGINSKSYCYSFYLKKFSSLIKIRNFLGVQFHPEKSGRQGLKFIRKFLLW
ncbi:imidazole glycerol phosphate synthase subunit HisH [Candidatus Vidania fulgoroideorum]